MERSTRGSDSLVHYPFEVVKAFEEAIAEYTGAPFATLVNSCTNALLLACAFFKVKEVSIPKRTYVGVPMSIIHAGGKVTFRDEEWVGQYRLEPYPIWDSARLLTSGMYHGGIVCLSLHWAKTLNLGQGGVILHDGKKAQEWFEKARFDGRTPGVAPKDDNPILGWHCYLSPKEAAEALTRLYFLPKHNDPLPPDDYPDLSKMEIFK
jgi:dTDP-4-amino-4,6-dideoxygalactose transaminase